MKNRKTTSSILLLVALVLGVAFLFNIEFPQGYETYFTRAYYNQYGPLILAVELLFAAYYLRIGHQKTNFSLALFGFTAILDPIFDKVGLFDSIVPLYGTIVLSICAIVSLWLAFKNVFDLKRISAVAAILSFVLGVFIELFFNYYG